MMGVLLISDERQDVFDFERLEHVVAALVEAYRELAAENAGLRVKLEEKARRIRSLEGQLIEANQLRQDVSKRIDDMIAQLDHLDSQLAGAEA
jgi:septal ring factor EnvC (AmiA/AmiB activator)